MAVCQVSLYPTIPDLETPDASGTPGGLYGAMPGYALGGRHAMHPLPPYWVPFMANEYYRALHDYQVQQSPHRLLHDITATQLTAGRTVYRGLMVFNSFGATQTTLKCYLTQPRSTATVKVRLDGTPSTSPEISRVANETTSPGGSFTSPTEAVPLTLAASIEAGQYQGLYIEWTIGAGGAAYSWDYWGLHFVSTTATTARSFYFYNHLLAAQTITTVASNVSGESVRVYQGETFTVTCSGDPAQNKVFVFIDTPTMMTQSPRNEQSIDHPLPGRVMLVDECTRTSAGVYSYVWRPTMPGYYRIVFDIGEDQSIIERNVL